MIYSRGFKFSIVGLYLIVPVFSTNISEAFDSFRHPPFLLNKWLIGFPNGQLDGYAHTDRKIQAKDG